MLAKMIREVPLPMPRLVICSPSHITNMVPPVSVIIVEAMKMMPGWSTTPWLLDRPTAMPKDWNRASATVRYRVYWLSCLRPASPPSLRSFSHGG